MITTLPEPGAVKKLREDIWFEIESTVGDKVLVAGDGTGDPDATYTVTVGEVGRHIARSNVPILAVQWVIAGGGPVAGYTVNQAAGVVEPITPTMMASNPLTFAWSSGPSCVVGVYIVTAYGRGYVENSFSVTSPHVNFFESMTEQVYVGPYGGRTFLRFGDPSDPSTPGIVLNAVLFGAQSAAGRVGILQLATNQRTGSDSSGQAYHWSLNGRAVLDVGPGAAYTFYQDTIVDLPVGGNAQIDVTDAPAAELGPPFSLVSIGDGNPVVAESYCAYLMFSPSGGIWIPLSVLTWTWEGYSQLVEKSWGPVQQPGNRVNPSGVPTVNFPTWNANTAAGHWVIGVARQRDALCLG